jgi:predicted AAA+ superfamily ATPase
MFPRLLAGHVAALARRFPAVVLLGARQVGKTTLARAVFPDYTYLDLEDPRTAQRFHDDPRFALDALSGGAILDEAQAVPALFAALRGVVDADRATPGRFVILGSAQPGLIRGVSESLAGRVAVAELDPLAACESEAGRPAVHWRDLWLKGGFVPAHSGDFREWWEAYLRTLLERDLAQYGVTADPLLMRRLLTMLAHQQGGLFNASAIASSLGVSYHLVQRYVDVLESVFLIRRLRPYFRNVGKRLAKAPKVYLRDSGLLHHLLNIGSLDVLDAHPIRGASWEGFVIEDVLRRERIARPLTQAWFWRTHAGAEMDLLLERADATVALEVKVGHGGRARAVRVLRDAMPDAGATRAWIVDESRGIELLGPGIARGGFSELLHGTP